MRRRTRLTASAAALVLALAVPLSACGDGQEAGGKTVYQIGFNTWGAGTPVFDVMGDETAYTIELYGSESSRVSDENMADKELQNIQSFLAAGVDGIVMQCAADPVLPQAAQLCAEAGIPFAIPTFVGQDEDRAEIAANNKYYCGSVAADLYMDGYLMGAAAAEDGHRMAVLIGGNIGDINFERRIEGFTAAFVGEGRGVILDTARCTSPAEGQAKAGDLLSANPNADCVYAMAGDYTAGCIAAEDTLGLEIPVYTSNADANTVPYIRNGRVARAAGGNDLASNLVVSLLINYLDGHPILNADGKAPELKTTPFLITTENVDDFEYLFHTDGMHPLADETLESLVWRCNPDVSYDTYTDLIEHGLTLEAMLAARG